MPPGPGRAWPSPRSWDMAATLLGGGAGGRIRRPGAFAARARRRRPGPGDRAAHLAGRGRPARPRGGAGRPRRPSSSPNAAIAPYAALSSVASAVAANPTPERWQQGWVVFGRAADSRARRGGGGGSSARPMPARRCGRATRGPPLHRPSPRRRLAGLRRLRPSALDRVPWQRLLSPSNQRKVAAARVFAASR